MNDLIEVLSAIPLAAAALMLATVYIALWRRLKADKHFIKAVAQRLSEAPQKHGEQNRQALRLLDKQGAAHAHESAFCDKAQKRIFAAAINDLAERDKRFIQAALKNNTNTGRVRYRSKVLDAALKLAAH